MKWVVDASVAVRWFLKDESHPNADAILSRLIHHPELFAVPELFCFEVYAVLCRVHPSGPDIFVRGMIPVLNSGIFRQPMTERLADQAVQFIKKGLTGYDSCYAALAREIKGVWLTFDQKAHRSLSGLNISHNLARRLPKKW